MFRVLDLFSGIGGFSLGLERAGMKTVAFVEMDKFCQKVLEKHWPDIPIFSDIRNFGKEVFNEKVDVICGGFPCQPFSIAGKRNGRKDNRYLWNEMFRVIQEFKPTWVIAENVHGILSVEQGMVFEQVCLDLESENYEVQSFVIPACAVNAPHRRDRVWIIANSDSTGLEGHGEFRKRSRKQFITEGAWKEAWIEVASKLCRVDDGVSNLLDETIGRLNYEHLNCSEAITEVDKVRKQVLRDMWKDKQPKSASLEIGTECSREKECNEKMESNRANRLRCLGNAVVPQIVEIIGRTIIEIESNENDEKKVKGG